MSDMPAKPIKFARVRQKLRKYRSKCPTCSSNVVFVKCANRSNHGRLSVLFFLPYITKRLIDSECRNRVRPKHRNGTQTPKRQDKHRNGTERRLYIHYSDIFVNSHAILGYIMLEMLKHLTLKPSLIFRISSVSYTCTLLTKSYKSVKIAISYIELLQSSPLG